MLKRVFFLTFSFLWFFPLLVDARVVPNWFFHLSGGYSYWKLDELNQRIPNRRPFFNKAGASNFSFKLLPSGHPSFDLGLRSDLGTKITILATFEYRQATSTNEAVTDSFRVEAVTRPRQINFGLDGFWRLGPRGELMVGGGGGLSFARFRDDVRLFDRRADPDSLAEFLLEKYSSLAIFGELRAVYLLPFGLFSGQQFFVEALGRLNPIEAFIGTTNKDGNVFYDVEATYFPPGSNTARPIKLDFSGYYIGFGSNFRL
ncbi:MAG: hypothetical protein L0196_09965 [candidate division Zixibacteria bacterium]|nr:hypothetical protein [candidate division Zixibacteria bacterium]